jgi:hypothetical protein
MEGLIHSISMLCPSGEYDCRVLCPTPLPSLLSLPFLLFCVYLPFFKTSITVRFIAIPKVNNYELQWKFAQQQSWGSSAQHTKPIMTGVAGGNCDAIAEPLQPGSSYSVRLAIPNDPQIQPGAEITVDTEQVGCTPGQKQGCCSIL